MSLAPASAREVRAEARARVRAHRRALLLACVLTLVSAVAALGVPFAVRHVVDAGVTAGDPGAVRTGAAAAALLALVAALADRGRVRAAARLAEAVLAGLRADVGRRLLELRPRDLAGLRRGELVSRAVADVEVLDEAVREAAPALVRAGALLAVGAVALLVLSPVLGLVAALGTAAVALAARRLLRRTRGIYARGREAEAAALAELGEAVAAARDAQVHRREPHRLATADARGADVVAVEHEARRARNRFYPVLALVQAAAAAAVLGTGAWLVATGRTTVGTVAAVALAVPALYGPLDDAVEWLDEVGAAGAAAARVVAALGLRPVPSEPPCPPADGPRGLSARGVRFAYRDGPPVLHGVDLDVTPGERVALVGRSGAGKSTLARLLARLEEPQAGVVRHDGVDLRALDAAALRRRVALLPQDAPLPAPTPRLAAAAVRPGTTDDELAAALGAVGAVLPGGLHTPWGPGGAALDAALRQQVALALVVLGAPDVVVLDEPTSALHADAAEAVERALAVALHGRAVVVVAHRLATALAADRVVVLDAGRVVEDGPPQDLLTRPGPFAALASAARPPVPEGVPCASATRTTRSATG